MLEVLESFFFGTEPIEAVQSFFGLGHPTPFAFFSLWGDTWGMLFVVGLALWLWGREACYATIGALLVGAGTKQLLTVTISVPRPEGPEIVTYREISVGSFPSGHVYQSVVPWGMLYALGRVPLIWPVLIVALIGIGRIYLGLHFVGDVVLAIPIAILVTWAYYIAWQRWRDWLAARPLWVYGLLGLVLIAGLIVNLMISGAGDNPRRWEILGMAVGGTLGMLLQERFVRYEPEPSGAAARAGAVAIGLAGIAVCYGIDSVFPSGALVPGIFTAGAATLWCVVGAPMLFQRMYG